MLLSVKITRRGTLLFLIKGQLEKTNDPHDSPSLDSLEEIVISSY